MVASYTYDCGGAVESVVRQTTYYYDSIGRCYKVQDHGDHEGGTTTFQYDGNGDPLS